MMPLVLRAAAVVAVAVASALASSPAASQETGSERSREATSTGTLVRRGPDSMLASGLGAIAVVAPGGEVLGDVSDTILSHDGRVVALIVGVGGFLGLAEKPVAIAYEHLTVRAVDDGFEFVCALDRAALEAAPRYRERE